MEVAVDLGQSVPSEVNQLRALLFIGVEWVLVQRLSTDVREEGPPALILHFVEEFRVDKVMMIYFFSFVPILIFEMIVEL